MNSVRDEGSVAFRKANQTGPITFLRMTFSEFDLLLAQSRASDAFRSDLAAFCARQPAERIAAGLGNPRVKVQRVVAQLLNAEPELELDRVSLRAASGCANFVGLLVATDVTGDEHRFDFEWNCEWKAVQLGYLDGFGFPDQIRAAQEFGWQCFERWVRVSDAAVTQPA
ncbi:MAG: hypothetical protein V4813_02215 [Gemmatimonadota bacterium]